MNRTLGLGLGLTTGGLAGYLLGIAVAYPGRSLSVTLVMIGIALAAIGSGKT
ncbi:hypothetical protein [Halalkalicoccus jeotgali]|uniref:Uncharacterized protein n=1 Tax=Halalkalicoccus jeotgali (strain DSM 18796 / CECT 7217 / JCM 14584 / KCTC 4019 / B3) TaxID=795797 RepID=D8J7K3_HALJB|nr:hypothetical protein [Halalkalicoccus jeotgali]ADJ16023.1 hypothetical protein HacjB3_13210 [Halalkalicoccus jeotgali B3]ELY38119.1 hypothetical protein C497_08414 [Halalkalicoccus jeotgali B3]